MVSLAYIYYKGINSMAAYSSTVHQLSGSRLFRGEGMGAERVWKILGHAPKLLATPLDRHSLIQYASLNVRVANLWAKTQGKSRVKHLVQL